MIILRSNLKNFYVKQNKYFVDLQYTFSYNNKWNKNVRNGKISGNVRFKRLDCDAI